MLQRASLGDAAWVEVGLAKPSREGVVIFQTSAKACVGTKWSNRKTRKAHEVNKEVELDLVEALENVRAAPGKIDPR
jgi:hypothetical protein